MAALIAARMASTAEMLACFDDAALVGAALRFERELAMGAIVGTLHDIVLTIGFFVVTQIEFNMTSIAAILTIVGYSLNETVELSRSSRCAWRQMHRLTFPDSRRKVACGPQTSGPRASYLSEQGRK